MKRQKTRSGVAVGVVSWNRKESKKWKKLELESLSWCPKNGRPTSESEVGMEENGMEDLKSEVEVE